MESRGNKKKAAGAFLKKDHHDSSNMIVAIRIRPLNNMENERQEFEIIRAEDKLLVSDIFFSFLTFILFRL
jgi:hypothetical protein|tara:strand:+ start:61 stop:273 length:213 start_codon:yes stop_codon:yes gene_type:complete